jgi:hypothetical protein
MDLAVAVAVNRDDYRCWFVILLFGSQFLSDHEQAGACDGILETVRYFVRRLPWLHGFGHEPRSLSTDVLPSRAFLIQIAGPAFSSPASVSNRNETSSVIFFLSE